MNVSRRWLLGGAAWAAAEKARAARPIPEDLKTPYKWPHLVVAPSPEAGAFDSKGADVPFVFRHQGRFWMSYVGFDGEGYQTGLASSEDLLHWRKEGLILPRDRASQILRYNAALSWILRENDVFAPGRLKRVNGEYLGVYHAYPKPGYEEGPAVIGVCRSRDLRRWRVEAPVLLPEEGAAWERGGLYKACLVEHRGVHYLFYNAKNEERPWKEQTGFATSRDLRRWSRYDGNPVIPNGGAGSPDERFASDPCVLAYRGEWAMFYYSLDREGATRDLLALSKNLRDWEKCEGALLEAGPPGSVDSRWAHKPAIIAHRGDLYHFYCAVSQEGVRGIAVARSRPFDRGGSQV